VFLTFRVIISFGSAILKITRMTCLDRYSSAALFRRDYHLLHPPLLPAEDDRCQPPRARWLEPEPAALPPRQLAP
jgi:hypothetical protein